MPISTSLKDHWFVVLLGLTIPAAGLLIAALTYFGREPEIRAKIDFDVIGTAGFMKPDPGLSDDLKRMGYKSAHPKLFGFSKYHIFHAKLTNVGMLDADQVEVKFQADGVLRYFTLTDGEKSLVESEPQGDIPIKVGEFTSIGNLKSGNNRTIALWCTEAANLKQIAIRYTDKNATRQTTYHTSNDDLTKPSTYTADHGWDLLDFGMAALVAVVVAFFVWLRFHFQSLYGPHKI